MTVSVIIQRSVGDKDKAERLASIIVKLRSLAAIQPGFINSQTFSCLDCQGEYLVISNWNTMEDWNRWKESEERLGLQRKVDELLGEETTYRYFEPVIGGIPPRFIQT